VPFLAQVGKNRIASLKPDGLFPLKINFQDPDLKLAVDLTLTGGKPILLQGDRGKTPAMYGLGSWYYSIPDIKAYGTITYQGEARKVNGKMWMDNQWMAGIMPPGYGDALWIRALTNILYGFQGKAPEGWAWDWTEVQFDDGTEVTFSAIHSPETKYLMNRGVKPPGRVTRPIAGGKYNPGRGEPVNITGEVTLLDWVKSPVSGAWYPCGWQVSVPTVNLKFKMTPLVKGQFMQFGNASEYKEGAVLVKGIKGGKPIVGAGFGESVGYEGTEFYLQTKFKILGIKDTESNRALMLNKVPGFWLVFQSACFFAALPLLLIVLLMIYLVRRRKRT